MRPFPDIDIRYFPDAFEMAGPSAIFKALASDLNWQQNTLQMFGRTVQTPRLEAWYGEMNYTYSGRTFPQQLFPEILHDLKSQTEEITGFTFNSALCNFYRDGSDGVSWHADDETELGKNPVIASLSFGAKRTFQLRHKQDKARRYALDLVSGSLLFIHGNTQQDWLHQIPKTKKPTRERINITFRTTNS